MALLFLPGEHVKQTFHHLESRAPAGPVKDLLMYREETWIDGLWSPNEWTVLVRAYTLIMTQKDITED